LRGDATQGITPLDGDTLGAISPRQSAPSGAKRGNEHCKHDQKLENSLSHSTLPSMFEEIRKKGAMKSTYQ
jgi:hypothetical protein